MLGVDGTSSTDVWAVGGRVPNLNDEVLILHWDGSAWTQDWVDTMGLLYGVSAISANDVWAVGSTRVENGSTLILHWDGTQWSVVPGPGPTPDGAVLEGISAVSANDIWAVGTWQPHYGNQQPLILHWTGSQWGIVQAPAGAGELRDVSAVSSNAVWAVGTDYSMSELLPLVLHWDGSAWSRENTPEPDTSELIGVFASSSNEVWSVGYTDGLYDEDSLIERYVGSCETPLPTPTPTVCSTGWANSASVDLSFEENQLLDVAAVAGDDVWAAGFYRVAGYTYPLAEHWDGAQWGLSSTGVITSGAITAVKAFASDDVWAVGSGSTNIIMRWDGEHWTPVEGPTLEGYTHLEGVDGLASNDLWVVGGHNPGSGNSPVAAHWDGANWTQPSLPVDSTLNAVKVVAHNDVWAVGSKIGADGSLILHWNGVQWTEVTAPTQPYAELYDIDGVSPDDLWAVGSWAYAPEPSYILHWNGTQWARVEPEGNISSALSGVAAIASDNVWFVGADSNVSLTLHWDGTSLAVVDNPHGGGVSALWKVSGLPNGDAWAVGEQDGASLDTHVTLAQHYLSCVSATSTPTASATATPMGTATVSASETTIATSTGTPTPLASVTHTDTTTPVISTGTSTEISTSTAAPTDTSVIPTQSPTGTRTQTPSATSTAIITTTAKSTSTATATATASACPVQFADVPDGHTFYSFVRCLACRGILTGYACGGVGEPCDGNNDPYFRPNNGVTRGQIAKIVSEAAGFDEAVSGQAFEDVPPGSTFYVYVERLASRGVMQGYPCGGAGEPCGTGSLPYFRPGAGATRGQLAKIASNAIEWADSIPAGQYTFADVPVGSAFHPYIERMLMHRPGAMSGYPCGGTEEPCDSAGRPYFRPGNTLTRGQTAKIVTNTFFPECVP